jgi:hypothetical protein
MPFFNSDFYESFGCLRKYTQNSTELEDLTCAKEDMVAIWEVNLGLFSSD